MNKRIDKRKLRKELIELYERCLQNKDKKHLQKKADKIYSAYLTAGAVLEETLAEAVDLLSGLTKWGKELTKKTGMKEIPKERIKEIIKKLKKEK